MKKHFKNKKLISVIGGLAAGFLNGLFGSGGGTVIVPFLEEFLEQDEHKAHATAIFIILCFTVVSLFFYGYRGGLSWRVALYASCGGVVGGFLGAKLLKKLSGPFLRKLFGAFMMIAAFRMVMR